LAAHESVWDEGVMLIGSFRTSLCVILVLQMYENETNAETHRIKNPGGYLRSMIRMVSDGKISLAREFASLKLKS
jgi:replication initiation protein RepC